MKPFRNVMGIVLCTCILATIPAASLPKAAALTTNNYEEALKTAPPGVKRTVKLTAEYFGMTDITVNTQGSRQVTLNNNSFDSNQTNRVPSSVSLFFSEKDNKLTQLTTTWGKGQKSKSADLEHAVSSAADFVESVIGENFTVAKQATAIFESMAEVSVYPIVKDIPVQKSVGRILVDSAGNISSFHRLNSTIDERSLPSKADILSSEQAKQAFDKQIKLELAYDDEQGLYQYVALPYASIDAKTGEATVSAIPFVDSSFTVGAATKEQTISSDTVKIMAQSFFGLNPEGLTASNQRASHPNETPLSIHTVSAGKQTFVVRVNEKTGELLSVESENLSSQRDSTLATPADAKKKALSFIEQFIPLKDGDYFLRETYAESGQMKQSSNKYTMELYPSINGVRTTKPIVALSLDLNGNVMTSVTTRAHTTSTAATPAVISADEAKKQWLKALELELNYVFKDPQSEEPILAYVASITAHARYVNAISGIVSAYQ
ncbi:hypothetical protein [Brevibacillus choshinensis]|uniref:hypothetical protein n=1 Tax=Brevibacillus choshinensis TaxID=54911 RepID=UPI002E21FD76|nr:hypothetical protein [Brevibacillus choshinensis]